MQIGFNTDESLLTGYGSGLYYIDLLKTARGHRTFRGAAVDLHGFPKFTAPGEPLSRIEYECAHFAGGLPEPYHGNYVLVTDGAAKVRIERKDRGGKTISTVLSAQVSGSGQRTPVVIPASAIPSNLRIAVNGITQPLSKLALVHESHLAAWDAGQTLTPDIIRLWKQGGGVVRGMKLFARADDNPAEVLRASVDDLYWTGSASRRFAAPYEPFIADCAAHGLTPWLNIIANANDAEVLALAGLIKKYGIPVYLEPWNEIFHAPRGGSPHTYCEAMARAKWPGAAGDGAQIGRQWMAWRWSQIIDLLTQAGVRGLVRTVYADQGNWSGWINHTFDCPLWTATAAADGEIDRLKRWQSGNMVDVFAFNNYYGEDILPKGNKPGIMDVANKDDPALVLAAAKVSIGRRTQAIAGVIADLKARFPSGGHEWAAYEGGMSDTANNFAYFRDLPEQEAAHAHWLVRSEAAGLDLNLHYADVGMGRWQAVQNVAQSLTDTPRGRALASYAGSVPLPEPEPEPPAPEPEPEPEPIPTPPEPEPEPEPEPDRDAAAIIADVRALLDELEAATSQ